jgi:hypothetical protein
LASQPPGALTLADIRIGRTTGIDHAFQTHAHGALGDHHPAQRKQDNGGHGRPAPETASTLQHRAFLDLDRQPGRAMHGQHRHGEQASQQGEGRKEPSRLPS